MFALLVVASLLSSPAAQVVTGVEDTAITARIETLYLLDQHLNPLNINTTTRDGHVMLSGSVNDVVQRELAEDLALGVRGVRFVDNQLVVIGTVIGEKEQRTWKQRIADRAVTAAVRARMLGNGEFKGLKVGISTVNNVVTLYGVVPTEAHVQSMVDIASQTKGVSEVVNNLTIRSRDESYDVIRGTGRQISDEWLESRIETAILLNRHLKIRELDVEVDDGICILSGSVDSEEKRVLASQVAENIQGIGEVRNDITVRPLGQVWTPLPQNSSPGLTPSDPPSSSLEGSEPPKSLEGSEPPEDDFPTTQKPVVHEAVLADP